MEHPDYRNNLELLLEAFPTRKILNITEVAEYTGMSTKFVKKHYMPDEKLISVPALARKMCGGGKRRR